CAPKAIPARLFPLLMRQGLNLVARQVEQPQRDEWRNAMAPVAIGGTIEDEQSSIGCLRRLRAHRLAARNPQDGRCGDRLACFTVEHEETLSRAIGVKIIDNCGLLLHPKLRSAACG